MELTNNKRYPIKINNNAVALISIYEREKNIEDIWFFDLVEKDEEKNTSQFAAQEFIHQLKDEWNGVFLESLILESIKEYTQYWSGLSKEERDEKSTELLNKIKEVCLK